jgi:hypothetical protein
MTLGATRAAWPAIRGAGIGGAAVETGRQVAQAVSPPPSLEGGAVTSDDLALADVDVWKGRSLYDQPPPDPRPIPPSGGKAGQAIGGAFLEQAGAEALGAGMMWPFKFLGRQMLGSRVATYAGKALKEQGAHILSQLSDQVTKATDAITARRELGRQTLAGVKEAGVQRIADLRAARRRGVEQVRGQLADFRVGSGGVDPTEAGQQAGRIMAGPAHQAFESAGAAVREAAETGPPVQTGPWKAKLRAMIEASIPETIRTPKARAGYVQNVLQTIRANPARTGRATLADQQALQTTLQGLGGEAADEYTPAGLLGKLLSLPDEIPYAEAHKIKYALAQKVPWDHPAKDTLTQLQKGMVGTIRASMRGHLPYDEATATREALEPLFRKGLTPAALRQIEVRPELLVKSIKAESPTALGLVKEVLTTQAERGGDGPGGRRAWDAVVGAWLHKNVTQGPLETLADRLDTLPSRFLGVIADTPASQQVLGNLLKISEAYRGALTAGLVRTPPALLPALGEVEKVAAAKALAGEIKDALLARNRADLAGARNVEATALRGLRDILQPARRAITAAKQETPVESALMGSPIFRSKKLSAIGADLAVSVWGSPSSVWKYLAIERLMQGQHAADLAQWAAYSPQRTQQWVRFWTSPAPGMVMADGFVRQFLAPFYADALIDQADDPEEASTPTVSGRRVIRDVGQALQRPPGPPRLMAGSSPPPAP